MIRTMISLTLVLAALLPCAAQDSGRALVSAARKRSAEARGLKGPARAKVLEDALALVVQVPERFPNDVPSVARACLLAGKLHRRLGREVEGRTQLQKVLQHPEEKRSCCDALHEMATSFRKSGQRKKAVEALERLAAEFQDQPSSRARALVRIGGLQRDLKNVEAAGEAWRRCLKDHGDRWRQAVDAVNGLVNLELKAGRLPEAERLLKVHGDALRARFAGTSSERGCQRALEKMSCHRRLKAARKKAGGKSDGAAGR